MHPPHHDANAERGFQRRGAGTRGKKMAVGYTRADLCRYDDHMPSERLVLVVEEEPSLQLTLCASLMMMGLTARRAAAVDAALGILGSARVDAIILSAQVPDSLTLLMFLRATAEYAHVPVLMFTVAPLSDAASAIALRNRADVFQTPYEYRDLVDRLGVIFDLTPAPLR